MKSISSDDSQLYTALREVVLAAGGYKAVGKRIFPQKATTAANKLRVCLTEGRREKLSPDNLVRLSKIGRECGCDAIINFFARDAGYAEPGPVDTRVDIAQLQRDFIEGVRSMEAFGKHIEVLKAREALKHKEERS